MNEGQNGSKIPLCNGLFCHSLKASIPPTAACFLTSANNVNVLVKFHGGLPRQESGQ